MTKQPTHPKQPDPDTQRQLTLYTTIMDIVRDIERRELEAALEQLDPAPESPDVSG